MRTPRTSEERHNQNSATSPLPRPAVLLYRLALFLVLLRSTIDAVAASSLATDQFRDQTPYRAIMSDETNRPPLYLDALYRVASMESMARMIFRMKWHLYVRVPCEA